jgi:hypothetical protein
VGTRLLSFACSERLEGRLELVTLAGTEESFLVIAAVPVAVHDQLMFTGWKVEALEHAVELVDAADVIAVDEDLRVARLDLQACFRDS